MSDIGLEQRTRPLITPEGVDLRVRLATFGERAAALLIDLAILLATVIALVICSIAAVSKLQLDKHNSQLVGQVVIIIWIVVSFLLRNFYFTLMECTPRAATWGKRALGLRVVARNGGALSADAVVTRNAMREIELYLPIMVLIASMFTGADVGAWIVLSAVIWCGIFALFPLFNRDRLRVGDLVAGTWVIKTPKQKLLPDLASEQKGDPRYVFTEAQLNVYGVKELQVLEAVLRGDDGEVMNAVAERIRTKITWKRVPLETDREFLNAYYNRLRQRLEQKLLFGVRKKDKYDRS
ncbi:MAG: RDD family protein [Terricaulis silvestris]